MVQACVSWLQQRLSIRFLKLLTKRSLPHDFMVFISGRSMEFHLVGNLPVHPVPSFLDAFKHGVTLGFVYSSIVFIVENQGHLPEPGLLLRTWEAP